MTFYHLKRTQTLPVPLNEAWSFFSTPENLANITPGHMRLKILSAPEEKKIYAGQIIRYSIRVLSFWKVHWVTEITYVNEPDFFVDEQRTGPYAAWTHQHHFRDLPEGVEITDTIRYAIPLGIIGRLANRLFVERALNAIFDFRFITLENHFKRTNPAVQKPRR